MFGLRTCLCWEAPAEGTEMPHALAFPKAADICPGMSHNLVGNKRGWLCGRSSWRDGSVACL
jgi:hypothetical protein